MNIQTFQTTINLSETNETGQLPLYSIPINSIVKRGPIKLGGDIIGRADPTGSNVIPTETVSVLIASSDNDSMPTIGSVNISPASNAGRIIINDIFLYIKFETGGTSVDGFIDINLTWEI